MHAALTFAALVGAGVFADVVSSPPNTAVEILAAIMGGLAAIISAVTGLVVALRNREQVIVVSPEQAEQMGLADTETHPSRRRRRRA